MLNHRERGITVSCAILIGRQGVHERGDQCEASYDALDGIVGGAVGARLWRTRLVCAPSADGSG